MFLLKAHTKGVIPYASVEDTLERCVESAKYCLEDSQLKDWEKIKQELSVRRKWTDGQTTVTITET